MVLINIDACYYDGVGEIMINNACLDYGGYASKEARVRRSLARREQRAHTPAQHLPLPPTVSIYLLHYILLSYYNFIITVVY